MQNILVTVIILALARPSWTGPEDYLYCRACSESQECDDGTGNDFCILENRIPSSNTTYPSSLLSEYECGSSFTDIYLLAAYHGAYCVTIVWKNGGEEQTTRGCRRATFIGQDICGQVKKACEKNNRELISCDTCQGPGKFCNTLPTDINRATNTTGPTTMRTTRSTKTPTVKGPAKLTCYDCSANEDCDDPVHSNLECSYRFSFPSITFEPSMFQNYTFHSPESRSHHPACGIKSTKALHFGGQACVTLITKVVGQSHTSRFCLPKYVNGEEVCTYIRQQCDRRFDSKVVSCVPCYTDLCNNVYTGPPTTTTTARPTTLRPTTSPPEAPRPATPKPETPRPETPRPETPRPETPRPETPRPETERPETFRPEFPKPDTTTPDMYRPDLPMPGDQSLRCYSCSGSTACANQINDPFTPQCQSSIVYDARSYNQSVERFSYFDDDPACGFTRFIQGEGPPVCFTFITNVRGIFFTNRGCARLEARGTYICMYIEQICGVKYVSCSTCRTPLCNTFGLAKNDVGTWKFGFSFINYIFVIAVIFSC